MLPRIKDQSLGRFEIALRTIENEPEMVRAIYDEVIPVSVEVRYETDSLRVIAFSKHFDAVEKGMMVPGYTVISNSGKIEFERQK